uniref:F-box protein 41 n=1 Tax=Nothobranchius furzeri TaxID=105023 RepID=A0A8C6M540_NOTFU
MSSSSELPYFCPRCGDKFRFSCVPELRAHLVSQHTYETLLVLSQTRVRSSRPGALLPLPGPAVSQKECSSLGMDPRSLPLPLACLDFASSSASIQMIREMFSPPDQLSAVPPGDMSTALALPGSLDLDLGLPVRIGLEELLGLGLDHKIALAFAEVEERVNRRVGRLKEEVRRKEAELEREKLNMERLRSEKQKVEERATYLSNQISAAADMMERLEDNLRDKDNELSERQQDMADIEMFLRTTAEKEAEAKSRLQVFIETLLERADRAERQLLLLSHHDNDLHYADPYTHSQVYSPVPGRGGRSLDGSTDDIISNKMLEAIGNRRSYSISGSCRLGDQHPAHHRYRMGDEGWGTTWSRRNLRHPSTEEEESLWSSADMRRLVYARTHTPGSDTPSSTSSTPSCHHCNRQLGADTVRMRAWLFCVLPYLDVRSLLRAAEVCSDWRFVARHPAVWTHLQLQNARVSSEFLSTLSQWCTQTQCVVLNNLKPRSRRADETPEDYHKNTRGSMEVGLEVLLRSAGGSLLQLSVSQCPHILTDRTLWLVSCYSRNLQTLVYRSSSDPVGHEVLWTLGAGCRNISSLQVAPAHPCQQPTRFGTRCLQTIGRCWPHLLSLSVGGAGCSSQGLVAVVRSCSQLRLLELERIADLGLQEATELCRSGLRRLQTLILTHTPVSGQAILHFHSACSDIRSIVVEVSASDYFEDPETQEARHLFGEILGTLKVTSSGVRLETEEPAGRWPRRTRNCWAGPNPEAAHDWFLWFYLQVLQNRPGLSHILQVKAEGFF